MHFTSKLRFAGSLLITLAPMTLTMGCGPSSALDSTSSALVGGSNATRPGSDAVVFLGACSGVLINPYTVASVEHCLPESTQATSALDNASSNPGQRTMWLSLRAGPAADRCLTPGAGGRCVEWVLKVSSQPETDVVLLQSAVPFSNVDPAGLPVLAATAEPTAAYAHGYGLRKLDFTGDAPVGTRLSAAVTLSQYDGAQIYGRAQGGARVCGGDSGGPVLGETGARSPVLLGVLSATQFDQAEPYCTAQGGLNRWSRIDPEFVREHTGNCGERGGMLDCRNTAVADPPPKPRKGLTVQDLRSAGVELFPRDGFSAAKVREMGLVGVATVDGHFLARLPSGAGAAAAAAPATGDSAGAPDGAQGEMVPLSNRALSLSNNGDQRDELFIVQGGGLREASSAGTPECSAGLIGKRIVRTAYHCIRDYVNQPYFTLRYNGGTTTWTFDGGATYVTFNPRQAITYWYGGNYWNNHCDDGSARTECIMEDWALVVMAQNVWDPVNVVPAYMGYRQPALGAVTNAGYPNCNEVSSPFISPCVSGVMYGMNCSIMVNSTAWYYTNCDTSGAQSGSPTFVTISGVRYLVGNHKGGPYNPACANNGCTSYDCGTNSFLYDFQGQLRAQYDAVTL